VAQVDLLATRPQYRHHLEPLWAALSPERRGAGHSEAVLVSSAQDLAGAARAGYRRVAYLEHGIGQTYGVASGGYPGGPGRGTVGLFLSPNLHAAEADRLAYPGARVEVVGDPRLDHLPGREPGPPAIAVSFHWECHVVPETLSALAHYRSTLPALAERYTLLGHGHPRAARALERVWRRLGVEWVPEFEEVCRRADLYVADNTSTLFEFASTGRPVVVLNAPWYRRHVEHGLRFWRAATVGLQVDEPGRLLDGVARALEDAPAQRRARAAALRLAYTHPHGAAERAARILEEWLG
jgi:hypothetical protein